MNISKRRWHKPLINRLFDKLDRSGDCWLWIGGLGGRDERGYLRVDGKNESASRIAYRLLKGFIPVNLEVCHTCDIPKCCNPSHLFLGTHSDNMKDSFSKGRKSCKGVKNPRAKLTEDDVREIRKRYPTESGVKLAEEFGTDKTQPYRIYNRIIWGSVE